MIKVYQKISGYSEGAPQTDKYLAPSAGWVSAANAITVSGLETYD